MSKHLLISQSKFESNISSALINKLYNMCQRKSIGQDWFDNTSNLIGSIQTGYTYQEYINMINSYFPQLNIISDGLFILFADKKVEQILIENFSDDPNGVKPEMVADVNNGFRKNNVQVFKSNTEIETFNELNKLTNIKKLGSDSFYGCTSLKSINLTNIMTLGDNCFRNCTSLSIPINMPNLQSIGYNNFQNTAITTINNLGSLTKITGNTFRDCQLLTTVAEGAFNQIIAIEGGAFRACPLLTSIGSTPNLVSVAGEAFSGCLSLSEFDFSNVTELNTYSFGTCTSLQIDLNIPNLTVMNGQTFWRSGIKTIQNLGTIVSIPGACFQECTQLTYINTAIINRCTSIGNSAFYGCTSLVIDDINAPNLSSIGSSSFRGTKLKKITNLGTITVISDNAFTNTPISSAVIPNTVINIGSSAFSGCSSLSSLTIDWSNIKSIGTNAFNNCSLLGSGETLELNLTAQSFYPWSSLAHTLFEKLIVHFNIPNLSIDYRYPMHTGMTNLKYIDISDTTVDKWGGTYGANKLITAVLPSTITYLEYRYAQNLNALEHFIILVEDPENITAYPSENGNDAFKGTSGGICTIYVKDETVRTKYLNHFWWGTIPNASIRIKILSELPTGVWTTGLYKQYEPYLSHQNDPVYTNLPY